DGSTRLTYVMGGTPGKRPVRFSQLPPSLRVSQTLPSPVPTQRIPARNGDSAIVTIVEFNSASQTTSFVIPPDTSGAGSPFASNPVLRRRCSASAAERSPDIATGFAPRSVDLNTFSAPL